jgi:hypothetical protein
MGTFSETNVNKSPERVKLPTVTKRNAKTTVSILEMLLPRPYALEVEQMSRVKEDET